MNYRELEKCYPEFKIPVEKHAKYYIDTLIKANYVSDLPLKQLESLELNHNVYEEKKKFFDTVLDYFKTNDWVFKDDIHKCDYQEKDFNDFKANKVYISFDLREANWQAFKNYFQISSLPNWEMWLLQTLRPHPFFAQSKSLRQFIMGNTNPKKLNQIQKCMMQALLNKLPSDFRNKVVGTKADELILEFDAFPTVSNFALYLVSKFFGTDVFKLTYFQVKSFENYNETVKIKQILDNQGNIIKQKFFNVSGNRFFLHLKTLLMQEELDERDLLFENDKRLAKWVV